MLLAALAAIVYVLMRAGGLGDAPDGVARYATGSLARLQATRDPPVPPAAAFTGPDGAPVTLADFRGEVVLLNLWATWCPPCTGEMPTLGALQAAYQGRGLRVVAASVDSVPDRETARGALAELSGGALTFYHDPNYILAYGLAARGFPTTILFDRNGAEIARLSGEADWNSPEAHALIDWALAGG